MQDLKYVQKIWQKVYAFYKNINDPFVDWQDKLKLNFLIKTKIGLADMTEQQSNDIKKCFESEFESFKNEYIKNRKAFSKKQPQHKCKTAYIYEAIHFFMNNSQEECNHKDIFNLLELYGIDKTSTKEKDQQILSVLGFNKLSCVSDAALMRKAFCFAPLLIKILIATIKPYTLALTIKATDLNAIWTDKDETISANIILDLISKTSAYLCSFKEEIQEKVIPFIGNQDVDYTSERDVMIQIDFKYEKNRKKEIEFDNRLQLNDFIRKHASKTFSLKDVNALKTTMGLGKTGFKYD